VKTVSLTQGQFALVDDEDHERVVAAGPWHIHHTQGSLHLYARHIGPRPSMVKTLMHRLILNAQPNQQVDHINGDGLDNRRVNLRLCTHSQNCANRSKSLSLTSSRYKGVSRCADCNRWRDSFKARLLGLFTSEEDAARAYDTVARETWGEFARLNFP